MHIDDASSIDDHVNKAVDQDFLMARPIPLPAEVDESRALIATNPPRGLLSFWNFQLKRVANYVDLTSGIQKIWDNAAPPEIRDASGKMKSIAISALLGNYDIGGASWMAQFTFGFPLVGNLSQEGIYPRDTSLTSAPPSRGSVDSPRDGLKHAHAHPAF